MEEVRFSTEHVWTRLDDDNRVTLGVSDFAQEEWGEIGEVILPEEGDEVLKDEQFGVLRTILGKQILYSSVSGEVTEVNHEVVENPDIINEDPLSDGWLIRVAISSTGEFEELLTEEEYEEFLKEEMGLEEEDEEEDEDLEDEDLEDEEER